MHLNSLLKVVICGGNPPTIHQRGDTVKQSAYGNIPENKLYRARLKYASAILLSHQEMGDAETAIRLLDEVLDLVPDFLDAYYLREELWHTILVESKGIYDHNYAYTTYLQSPAWKGKREQAMNRDDHRCALCNNSAENVHHKTYDNIGKEPLDDLTSLCKKCYKEFHKGDISPLSAAITDGSRVCADPTRDIFDPSSNNDEMGTSISIPLPDDDIPW